MEFNKLIEARRSIRFFKDAKVSREAVETIIDAGRYAPRASNRQHWEAIVVDDKETIEKLYRDGGAQKTVLGAPAVIVIAVDMRFNVANYDNIQSTCAAAENMLLKIVDLGLGGCWVVGFGNKENVRKILNIPEHFEPLCYLLVGQPKEDLKLPPPPPKKALNEIIHYNKYYQKTLYLPSSIRPSKWTLEQIRDHQRFVSRARHLGIDYEFYSAEELGEINRIIKNNVKAGEKVLFMLGYDGTILKSATGVLENNDITDCELHQDIINFVSYKAGKPKYSIYGSDLPESFDVVVLPFSLEKLPNPDVIIAEASRILKPSGKILIFNKNKLSFYGLMYFCIEKFLGIKKLEGFYMRSGPFEPMSVMKLKSVLRKNNFNVTGARGMFFLPPEVSIFSERLDGYLKRHGKKLSFLKHFMRGALSAISYAVKITSPIKISTVCSSTYIVAEKKIIAPGDASEKNVEQK